MIDTQYLHLQALHMGNYVIDNQRVKILVPVLLLTSCQNLYKSFPLFESHFPSNTGVG